MINYLRLLLLPFSAIYGIVILIRNKLYDLGLFKSVAFEIPVICVGNLVVGGSGKSPVTEYLVNLLSDKRIAILSRGYGRNTKGFILADKTATAHTIGDEPMQFYHKFPDVTVAVCEDREKGINLLKDQHDLIILDDAFQHRRVKPGFSIVLFEYEKLLKPQFLLPAGNLREQFKGYQRAKAIMITKVPDGITNQQRAACLDKFNVLAKERLSFSALSYEHLRSVFSAGQLSLSTISDDAAIFVLTGIANPKPLLAHLKQYTSNIKHHDYPDHYQFSIQDIRKLVKAFDTDPSKEKLIITTEKDAQRLLDATLKELLLNLPVFYLPIKIRVQDNTIFDQKILDYVSSTTRDH